MPSATFPETPTPSRIAALRAEMARGNLDAFWVLIEANRRYLSGYRAEDGQCDETAGALLITREDCLLVTDSRYELQARQEAPAFSVIRCVKSLFAELPDLLTKFNVRRLGFESARLTVKHHQDLLERLKTVDPPVALVPTENKVESLRAVKDAGELSATRRAVVCAETAFKHVTAWMRPGMSERAVARKLEELMVSGGAEGASFPIIVAAGPNSAKPHAVPGNRPIATGEPILFDWGARLDGYCSDISRTIAFAPLDDRFHQIYAVVRGAQAAAVAAIRSGVRGQAVDAVARDFIARAGYQDCFGHSLGHGTGLAIHEAPRLSPFSEDTLASGMVVTVEPGIYLPDWGGVRLENQVVVTDHGAEILNHLSLDDFALARPGDPSSGP